MTGTTSGRIITLVGSVANGAAFSDSASDPASRIVLRRDCGLSDALDCLVYQPGSPEAKIFDFGGYKAPPTVPMIQTTTSFGKTLDERLVAVQIPGNGIIAWWNNTVGELLGNALQTVRCGRFASFIAKITGFVSVEAQMRFRFSPGPDDGTHPGIYQVQFLGILGRDGGSRGMDCGRVAFLLPGFGTHSGAPLRLVGALTIDQDLSADGTDAPPPFWRLAFKDIAVVVEANTKVRLGALDLNFGPSAAVPGDHQIKLTVTRCWPPASAFGQAGGADGTKWLNHPTRLDYEAPPSIPFITLSATGLPFTSYACGGQDLTTRETDSAGTPGDSTLDSLLLPVKAKDSAGSKSSLWLDVDESSSWGKNHSTTITIKAKSVDGSSPAITVKALVLDPRPFLVALVESTPSPSNPAQSGELATWSSAGSNGASWNIGKSDITLRLPPQAVGEGTEKWLDAAGLNTNPVDIGPDVKPGQPADMRFGTNAKLRFNSSHFQQNFAEPGWNLRRLMEDTGERDPGVLLSNTSVELLYGLNAVITYPHLRLAEIVTYLGEMPDTQVPPGLDTSFPEIGQKWQLVAEAWQSRLAMLEARDETVLLDDLKKRDSLLLTDGLVFNLRTPPKPTKQQADEPPYYGGLPVTPRLRYPVSKAILEATPSTLTPSLPASHADSAMAPATDNRNAGLPGGFQWGFDDVPTYEELWRQPRSTSAELLQLIFSALGGTSKLKARFSNDKTIIQAHVTVGRTHYYTLERVGRIAVFWVRAKHVTVFERTVTPTNQFKDAQDPQLGRPVLRKVWEYIEILEPDKAVPDQNGSPTDCGPVQGIVFHDRIILVDGAAWGKNVFADSDDKVLIGQKIPLWQENTDPSVYPKPQINLRHPADAANADQLFLAPVANPQNLWFYTDTRDTTGSDVMAWPSIHSVDYFDGVLPPAYLDETDYAATDDLEGDLGDPVAVPPGFENFTFQLDDTGQKANLTAGRTTRGQVSATLRNVTLMRSSPVSPAQTPPAAATALQSAGKIITALDGVFERAAAQVTAIPANGTVFIQSVKNQLGTASQHWGNVKKGLPKGAVPPAPTTDQLISQPLATLINSQIQAINAYANDQLFVPWQNLLQNFDSWADLPEEEIGTLFGNLPATAQNIGQQADEGWPDFNVPVDGLISAAYQPLERAMASVVAGIQNWLGQCQSAAADCVADIVANINAVNKNLTSEPDALAAAQADIKKLTSWLNATKTSLENLSSAKRPTFCGVSDFIDKLLTNCPPAANDFWTAQKTVITHSIDTYKNALAAFFAKIPQTPSTWDQVISCSWDDLSPQIDIWLENINETIDTNLFGPVRKTLANTMVAIRQTLESTDIKIPSAPILNIGALKSTLRGNPNYRACIKGPPKILAGITAAKANATSIQDFIQKANQCVAANLPAAKSSLLQAINATYNSYDPNNQNNTVLNAITTKLGTLIPFTAWPGVDLNSLENWLAGNATLNDWAARADTLVQTYNADAEVLAGQLTALGAEFRSSVADLTGQAQQVINAANRAAGATTDLAQAADTKIKAFRAFCQSPDIFPVKFNRANLAFDFAAGQNVLDMTPVVARLQEAGDSLAALGLRLPTRQALDRFIPPDLQNFDISRIFSDIGGIRLDDLLPNLPMPELSDQDDINVSHGFDRQSLRAWVKADVDMDLPTPATLFSIGPVAVTLNTAHFQASLDVEVDASGHANRSSTGSVRGDWEVAVGGTSIVTFLDTALNFENGRLHFDLQPGKIQLNAVLKMLSDLLPQQEGGGSENEDAEGSNDDSDEGDESGGISIGFTTIEIAGVKIPSGVRVNLDLPLPDLAAGTFSITGLQLGAYFRLRALKDDGSFGFQVATGFNFGRQTAPFALTIFILGGGGWVEVAAEYAPGDSGISTDVTIGVTANAVLAINFGVVSGSVGVYLGIFVEFHQQQIGGGSLSLGVMLLIRGNVNVLGIVDACLSLLLELIYQKSEAGTQLIGVGTVHFSIKICWCFTLNVTKSVTYHLAGSSGGSHSTATTKAVDNSSSKPIQFGKRLSAAQNQSALVN